LSGGLQTVDLPLTPVQPFSPLIPMAIPALGEQPELILKLQRFTAPFDMTGNPTITLAAGFSKARLPIAIQLVAYDHHELELICAGRASNASPTGIASTRSAWQRAEAAGASATLGAFAASCHDAVRAERGANQCRKMHRA
jgi:Asp-tRNA(Asn)/Glu-tRNA(Gln) amidotransferase A subunit family amidase